MSNKINVEAFVFLSIADRSKARHRLRSKISAEKKELTQLVAEYNKLPSTLLLVDLEDVLQHKFPWELPDDNARNY